MRVGDIGDDWGVLKRRQLARQGLGGGKKELEVGWGCQDEGSLGLWEKNKRHRDEEKGSLEVGRWHYRRRGGIETGEILLMRENLKGKRLDSGDGK